ncbi:filamentous hemagglutinin N-terminal domain-containing protein [Yoonia sp.]|uniref:two-partner secretion domain-containing protein n=1 Tax=Yoonia sp. TaxID=2212373 RepID=UPI0025F309E5|nr:filamentous hemagglutinin N-terminal domain-containing protein [Yoonia sp.]
MKRRLNKAIHIFTSWLSIFLISAQPIMAQSIVSDDNGPVVIEAANGTTMVMISTPDANGVSHNTFVEFSVGADGAILNNVGENTATTQLGGIVQGNSNLAGGTASVIINEVTSTNPSVLNGYLEVGGDRADVIVANPYGITCDGCGFINTDRLTVTTGSATYDGNTFTGFSVDGGAVNILGGGLDATDTTRFDLISRQITVAGAVHGQRIRVIAGRNDVIYATGEVIEKVDDGSTAPTLAIDSTVVGGMYANAITITSTEDGVGVRAPTEMAANAGEMMITADGRLVMGSASATGSITATSTTSDVEIEGTVVATQNVKVTTAEDLVLAANAKLVADVAADLTVGNDMTVGTGAEIASGAALDIDVTGAVQVATAADVIAAGNATVTAASVTNDGTLASSGGTLDVTANGITNSGLMFGDSLIALRSDGAILNDGGEIVANGNINIGGTTVTRAASFTNQNAGRVETITGNITIAATDFLNTRAAPVVDDAYTVDPDDLGDATCTGDDCTDPLVLAGAVTVTGEAAQIISAGNITLTGDTLVNQYSQITAFGDIAITAASLENIGANIYEPTAGSPTGLTFVGAVFGTIEAGGTLSANVSGYTQNGAAADDVVVEAGAGVDLADTVSGSIGDSALLIVNTDPTADFLVETRDEFVDLDQFVSSDYFLTAIEYDPELKRFGDAYAEALYIRKQLLALLGQLILTAGVDERAQIQAMYDNAIDAQQNLDLTVGVALTPDQIGALTTDIIWLEETVIDGQTVLAPKVYLANPEIRLAGLNGAMIVAREVSFRGGDFSNNGTLRAQDGLAVVSTGTFSTSGTLSAQDVFVSADTINVETAAHQVVTLRNGETSAFMAALLASFTGDDASAPELDRQDRAARPSTIEAGSTLVLRASNDITTAGADISAGSGAAFVAGGDITIGALALSRAKGDETGSNHHRIESLTHLTSTITSGGDITLLSSGDADGQNDILLEAATLEAAGAISMVARDGDLVLAAAQDMYFSDRATSSSSFFGFKKKQTRDQVLDISHQVTSLSGTEIVAVAAQNLQIDGTRFVVSGTADGDAAAGELALISVNGSTAFNAPVDIRAESHYRSSSVFWGLISNSKDLRTLASQAQGASADTVGDLLINSGADLTMTAVDFNIDGQFHTDVAGATYLLAAIDMDYQALIQHKDNGIIMTDIRSEDMAERVTYNGIVAAGGVNFDADSPIIFAGLRHPLLDSAHPAAWVAGDDDGRINLAGVYLDEQSDDANNDSDVDEEEHWRDNTDWAEDDGTVAQVLSPLPTSADGAEYAYIAGLLGRDTTINDPITLVSYEFYDKQQALSPAFKALLTIVVTQGLAGPAGLAGQLGLVTEATAATATAAATSATVTSMGLAVNAAAASTIVGVIDGAVAGDIDMGEILGAAAFAAVSAGLTAEINLDSFGGSFEDVGWANTSAFKAMGFGFGENLTIARLVEAGIDATITSGLSTAVYETDFLDSFGASMRSSAISLTMADLQNGIGDGVTKGLYQEGDLAHAALHGLVGCAAAEALDGNCASGAAAAIAQSIYAGTLDDTAPDESDTAAYAAWQAQVADQAQLIGASVGYITSAGLASNVSNGGSIAQSGVVNNFLSHLETIEKIAAEEALAECAEALLCTEGEILQLRAEVLQWTLLDEARDLQIQQLCAQGNALGCIGVYNELGEILAEDLAFYNTLDPDSVLARAVYAEGSGNDQLRDRLLELGGQAGARNTQITLNGFGFGAAGGAGAAVIVFGGPAALRCAADYTCRTNLALGLADELAMTPGAFTGTIAVTGTTVKVAGDVIGTLDDAKGFVRATKGGADDVFETGANITPNRTLDRYSHIGADGTFVTEVSSIENVIGRIPSNATEIRITRQQAAQLETDLGLNPGSLEANNTLSLVDDIAGRCPRCPIGGNDQFLGGGQGLPGGGSELVIDSIPSSGGNGVRQIMVIVE